MSVNGYVQGKNISVNMDSAKALNTVVGHEITHILEGTELYTGLQESVKAYAQLKGEYDNKLQSITKFYENENADIEKELTAELVGEYLFSDTDFISNLSMEKPTLFKKVFDEIKYLCNVVTAGSKEARQLEKVKKTFEDVYRQKNNTVANDGVRYDISKDMDGNVFVDVTEDIFDIKNGETVARTIQKTIKERFNNLINIKGQNIQVNKTTNDEFRRSKSANKLLKNNEQAYNDKLKTIANADEILLTAKKLDWRRIEPFQK